MSKPKKYEYIQDKCKPRNVDMGHALVFADAIPGVNDNFVRPFGWTEYESAYRPKYVLDTNKKKTCRPQKGRPPPLRQFQDPCKTEGRIGICTLCNLANCCCNIHPPWDELREKVVVYDTDNVRTLFLHNELKTEHPVVVPSDQYQRLFAAATVKSKEQKQAECECLKAAESNESGKGLAEDMRLIDRNRYMEAMSPEQREDEDEIICRADKIIKDDEPEIRTINKVILSAKVQAIREAQLAEKVLMRCEEAEEEMRLAALLKQDEGHVLIKNDEDEQERLKEKQRKFMQDIKLQMEEHEAYKYLDQQYLEAEREKYRQIWEKQDLEDITKKHLEVEKKHTFGKALIENQLEIMEMRKQEKEFDLAQDRALIEWQRKRAEEAERAEKEKQEQAKAKAMANFEQGRSQQRASEQKAARDELRARRYQEEQEREWRRREREAITKRQDETRELRRTILGQIRERQEYFLDQAAYDKALYDRNNDIMEKKFEDFTETIEQKKMDNARYRYDLREQIHEYQLRMIQERKDHFIEGINLRKQLAKKNQELKCTVEQKLEELRESELPEKYISYIRKAVAEEMKPDWQKSVIHK